MSKSNYPLRLQTSLLNEVRRLTEAEGASIKQFINVAVAEKLSALRTESYFRERAARADVPAALALLERSAPSRPGRATRSRRRPGPTTSRAFVWRRARRRPRRVPRRRRA